MNVFLSPPHLSEEGLERTFLEEAIAANWIGPIGPQIETFEREFAAANASPHAVAVSSGTAALHLALRLLGVSEGDEVLCSTFTFVATAAPIVYQSARPVFIDSDPTTWTMDPNALEDELRALARAGKRPKAVVVVDVYGQSADFEPILETCARYGVPVVEDAAEALGATYRGVRTGNAARLAIFSFNGNKIITTSTGGMLVTADARLAGRARHLATQARDQVPHYEHSEIGYNYRLSSLLAAFGRGQLRVLDRRVASRRANFDHYRRAFAGVAGIGLMPEAAYGRSSRWLTCITVDPEVFGADPEAIRRALAADGIESRPVWKPLHLQPAFRGCRAVGGGVADRLFARGLCLPSGSDLTDATRQQIVDIVRDAGRGDAE